MFIVFRLGQHTHKKAVSMDLGRERGHPHARWSRSKVEEKQENSKIDRNIAKKKKKKYDKIICTKLESARMAMWILTWRGQHFHRPRAKKTFFFSLLKTIRFPENAQEWPAARAFRLSDAIESRWKEINVKKIKNDTLSDAINSSRQTKNLFLL